MERFSNGQRVRVTQPLNEEGDPDSARESLIGKIGTVVRLRMKDMGAFVSMDETPEHTLFPAGDERHNHALLYPDECESVAGGA